MEAARNPELRKHIIEGSRIILQCYNCFAKNVEDVSERQFKAKVIRSLHPDGDKRHVLRRTIGIMRSAAGEEADCPTSRQSLKELKACLNLRQQQKVSQASDWTPNVEKGISVH